MEKMSVITDCGFCEPRAGQYMEAIETTNYEKQLMLLREQRMEMLNEMHAAAKKIDCIDFLICECRKKIGDTTL